MISWFNGCLVLAFSHILVLSCYVLTHVHTTYVRSRTQIHTYNTVWKVSHWLLRVEQTTPTHVYDIDKPTSTADTP